MLKEKTEEAEQLADDIFLNTSGLFDNSIFYFDSGMRRWNRPNVSHGLIQQTCIS
ncbi:hypothetical protein [Mesobacillus selenatarsenatis]|uniref:Uncharacterized protein n=1 Tax=Mesobacillus selenatarsenatis (strain DSM 18680 / JCM 14380 / FERM P-15431 / SF-1) TaxID=1321606 RepID=A0A0A8X413_MESS1|nr:hypothetical protein [Mesobacillus selenatarsenatis]GAM12856.1 hypothetical protein SAMD00020551_0991 [Mesobacillus selenatarsenatis SF-1]